MAKDNLFLGFGRGSVGDVTFSRMGGQQVARARNRHPSNPQTMLQLTQRSVMKTVAQAYSMLSTICDHAFEGMSGATENQSRFAKLNVAMLRDMPDVKEVLESGDEADFLSSAAANFAGKNDYGCELNAYIISEGSLPSVQTEFVSVSASLYGFVFKGGALSGNESYADIIRALSLQRGDQLTFVQLWCDDTENYSESKASRLQFSRVILEPASGDLTAKFFSVPEDGIYTVNSPNPRNQGDVKFWSGAGQNTFVALSPERSGNGSPFPIMSGVTNTICAMGCIVSRQSGGMWLRSSSQLALRPDTVGNGSLAWDHHTDYLGTAIRSFLPSTDTRSLKYLNQAQEGSL